MNARDGSIFFWKRSQGCPPPPFDAFCSRTRERSQKRSAPDEPLALENSRTRRQQCYDRSSTIKPVASRQERNEIKDFLSPAFVDRLQKRPSLYANFSPRLLLPLLQKSRQTSSTNTSSLSKCSQPMQLCTRFPNKTAITRLTKRTWTNKHKKPKKKTKNKKTHHKNQAKNKTSIYSHTSTRRSSTNSSQERERQHVKSTTVGNLTNAKHKTIFATDTERDIRKTFDELLQKTWKSSSQ